MKIEIVNRGPHEYRTAPTKRSPDRLVCVWCGASTSEAAAKLAAGLPEIPCPAHGDEEAIVELAGEVVRLWLGRRTRTPYVAVVETDEWEVCWPPDPAVYLTMERLRWFALGVVSARRAPPVPTTPLPANVVQFRPKP